MAALSQASGIESFAMPPSSGRCKTGGPFQAHGRHGHRSCAETAFTEELGRRGGGDFPAGSAGRGHCEDARRFTGHMLMEMARMSLDDGLVMQFHVGSIRGHNPLFRARFGTDKGADIPTTASSRATCARC